MSNETTLGLGTWQMTTPNGKVIQKGTYKGLSIWTDNGKVKGSSGMKRGEVSIVVAHSNVGMSTMSQVMFGGDREPIRPLEIVNHFRRTSRPMTSMASIMRRILSQ